MRCRSIISTRSRLVFPKPYGSLNHSTSDFIFDVTLSTDHRPQATHHTTTTRATSLTFAPTSAYRTYHASQRQTVRVLSTPERLSASPFFTLRCSTDALPIFGARKPQNKVAALALLNPAEPELSQSPHHFDIAPHLLSDTTLDVDVGDEAIERLMMAQPVPHQTTADKKRVKVYELRNNDWFDRGTGFCTACFVTVCCAVPVPRMAENTVSLMTQLTHPSDPGRAKRTPRDRPVRRPARQTTARDQNSEGRWLPEAAGHVTQPLRYPEFVL